MTPSVTCARRSLFIVSRSPDRECQYMAAMCFRKLSPVISNHDTIISKGGLQPLINLIQLKDVAIQKQVRGW
jgi:hypothetical protein